MCWYDFAVVGKQRPCISQSTLTSSQLEPNRIANFGDLPDFLPP
jgi:hypothetical protein